MIVKYRQFLITFADRFILFRHYNAARYTYFYYMQRSELKSKYKLRLHNIPYLIYKQQKKNYSQKKSLLNLIFSTYKSESQEKLENFVESNNFNLRYIRIENRLSHEFQSLKKSGLFAYCSSKLADSHRRSREKLNPEYISKWIVGYANLYHKSLEELVEGHREVTRNHDLILDDGKSVNQKLQEFQEKISGAKIDYRIIQTLKDKTNSK